jgi:hypothetical protein
VRLNVRSLQARLEGAASCFGVSEFLVSLDPLIDSAHADGDELALSVLRRLEALAHEREAVLRDAEDFPGLELAPLAAVETAAREAARREHRRLPTGEGRIRPLARPRVICTARRRRGRAHRTRALQRNSSAARGDPSGDPEPGEPARRLLAVAERQAAEIHALKETLDEALVLIARLDTELEVERGR